MSLTVTLKEQVCVPFVPVAVQVTVVVPLGKNDPLVGLQLTLLQVPEVVGAGWAQPDHRVGRRLRDLVEQGRGPVAGCGHHEAGSAGLGRGDQADEPVALNRRRTSARGSRR